MSEEGPGGEIRFSRELDPLRAISLCLAVLVAVAIFGLYGRIMTMAGPSGVLSYLFLGIVFLLTLLCYVELYLNSTTEGGAYLLIREATKVSWGFHTGWFILLGGVLLSALLGLAFAAQVGAMAETCFSMRLPEPFIASCLILLITFYNILGGRALRRNGHLITWGVIAALLVLCLLCLPRLQLGNLTPFSPHGAAGVQAGLLLLLIGFLAFESVTLSASEIRSPRQTIPRVFFATLSVGIILCILVALLTAGAATPGTWEQPQITLAGIAQSCAGRYAELLLLSGLVLIPAALNSTILLVVRQVQAMGEDNLLPDTLRRSSARLRTPHLLLLLAGAAAAGFSLLGDIDLIARLGGFAALFVMSMIALADVVRQRHLGQSPGFQLPFRPLVPALALAVNFLLLPTLGVISLIHGAVWLSGAVIIYMLYARRRYIVSQQGVVVFKAQEEAVEADYRILLPLGQRERYSELIKVAAALAGDQAGAILPLRVVTVPEQVPLSQGAKTAREIESLFSWSLADEDTGLVSLAPITRVARTISQGILDTAVEEECDLVLLSWEGYTESKGTIMGHVLDPVVENAPCDVLLVKGDTLSKVHTILVPTSGGPHASLAAQLALKLARALGASVTMLYVLREGATAEDRRHGLEMIDQTVGGLGADDLIRREVVVVPGVVSGILAEAERHDLVLLGATGEGLFDRFLFGTVPERIARKSPVPVMIARRHAALPRFWARRMWSALRGLFPALEAEERSAVYRQIREEARADVDFFVMIALSAIIATLGLLLNSPAVIIGAMLVAPLMSPIIGIALAITLGNVRLLRDAAESTLKGIFLAVLIAFLLASISPLTVVNEEIVSRTAPNLLDLVVALASGAAGAYALSRKDVSAALPGVAIAAALVPPLGVIGIGLAMHRGEVAGGGLLLFTTDLVAITLAGAVNFLLLGFRPPRGVKERESRFRRGLVVAVTLLFLVSLPLAFIFGRTVQATQQREVIDRVLNQEFDSLEHASLVSFEVDHQGDAINLTVTVYASQDISEETVKHLDDVVTEAVDQPVALRLIAIPVSETQAP
jgi:uncharacterized hydrophobic protein (TIGR00271 family)